jgi:uncharacterized protein
MLVQPIVFASDQDRIVLIPAPLVRTPNLFLVDSGRPEVTVVDLPDRLVAQTYFKKRRNRSDSISVLLMLNDRCNLACSYCFERQVSRTNQQLSEEDARCAIDFIIQNAMNNDSKEIFISLFGGEPSLSLPLVHKIVGYAKDRCASHNRHVNFGITTNGFFDEDTCSYITDTFSSVILSIDGPPALQDRNRRTVSGHSTFERVFRNAKRLFAAYSNEKLTFRVTMTRCNNSDSKSLVDFFEKFFPGAFVHVEPAMIMGEKCDPISLYASFAEAFKSMLAITQTIHLQHSTLLFKFRHNMGEIDYCGASRSNFYVTPDGRLTACSRVLRLQDPHADLFSIGSLTGGKIHIDNDVHDRLSAMTLDAYPTCQGCIARFNCKGGCPWMRAHLPDMPDFWSRYCTITRDLTKYYLASCLKVGSNAAFNVDSLDV